MKMTSIKLSPKKNGKGYASSYSVNISTGEAQRCNLETGRVIKLVDTERKQIIIKSKEVLLDRNVINHIILLKRAAIAEEEQSANQYRSSSGRMTSEEAARYFLDRHTGKINQVASTEFIHYLQSLSLEMIADIVLLMYMGRDYDCNMSISPGDERFLEFYDRYQYIVEGRTKDDLIVILDEKDPLPMYLETGLLLMNASIGVSIDEMLYLGE